MADGATRPEGTGTAPPQPTMRAGLDAPAIVLMTVMCLCLALGQVAIKIANAGISPILQAGLRSLAAAVLLAIVARLRGTTLFARDGILWPALLVSAFFTAEFAFLYPGIALTTAGHAVVLLYTSPFFVALGAHLLIPGDRLTLARTAGLVLATAGVAAVVLAKETAVLGAGQSANASGPSLAGDLLCLAGAVAWAGLTLTIRVSRLKTVAPERVTFTMLAVSGPILCALSLLLDEPGVTLPSPRASTELIWGAFAFTVVFVAGFVFTSTNWLLARYPASRVMSFMLLTPLFGVIAAWALLDEPVGEGLAVGLALVLAGLWLINRPTRAAVRS